jgi:Xaa-Pro aminopeptidase
MTSAMNKTAVNKASILSRLNREQLVGKAFELASKIESLPVLNLVAPRAGRALTAEDEAGYLACQKLAKQGAAEIAALMDEGWTETQTADLYATWLADNGVRSYFHKPFVWFGERTRFNGVRTYWDYRPSRRVLLPGEVFILDVAPIHDGYICDIGYTSSLGPNPALAKAQAFLAELKADIPKLFIGKNTGGAIWASIDKRIKEAGYDNIHALYPFSVLGHRVYRVKSQGPDVDFIHFGWQSYWSFLSRGLFGQLLNQNYVGRLQGLWAVEPHIGTPEFGAKFEEILVVDRDGARWLEHE